MRLAANKSAEMRSATPKTASRRPRRWRVALGIPGPYVTERLRSASGMRRATAVSRCERHGRGYSDPSSLHPRILPRGVVRGNRPLTQQRVSWVRGVLLGPWVTSVHADKGHRPRSGLNHCRGRGPYAFLLWVDPWHAGGAEAELVVRPRRRMVRLW